MSPENFSQDAPPPDQALEDKLRAQVQAEAASAQASGRPSLFSRASTRETIGFIRQLAILAKGQHTLLAALEVLARSLSNKDLSSTIEHIATQVEEGVKLSVAMGDYPWYFSDVTTGIIAAAEESGSLGEALEQIADDLEDDQLFRGKLFDALLYPAVLLGAFFAMTWGLLVFIVPQFSEYIVRTGGTIEGFGAVLLSLSEFVQAWYGMPLLITLFLVFTFVMRRIRKRNPLLFEVMLSRVPLVGSILRKASMRRFIGTLNLLLRHNVDLPQALALCEKVVSNHYIAKTIAELRVNVDEGKPMGEVLHQKHRLPPVVVDMLSVGEETGQMTEMLSHLVIFIRADFDRVTTRLAVMLQPTVLLLMGGLFVSVFLSFFLPYFEVLANLATQK